MNEEVRALDEARRVLFDSGAHPALVMAFEQRVRLAARTFSAEDVERAMLALHRSRGGNDVTWAHMWASARTKLRSEVCAALAAIGTVEEAQ